MASVRKRVWTTSRGERRAAWLVDYVDANGRRKKKLLTTKREADSYRQEIEAALRSGTYRTEAETMTLRVLVEEHYLPHCESRWQRGERMSQHNLIVYRGLLRNYVLAGPLLSPAARRGSRAVAFDQGIGELRLRQVTAGAVGDFRDALREAGLSVATTRKVLAVLQQVLAYAIGRDLLAVNAAKGVRVLGRRSESSRRVTPPSKEDLRRLIQAADQDFACVLVFAAASGLRAGELHALRWDDLDLVGGEVRVRRRVDAYRSLDLPKTDAGLRTIPVAAEVVRMLKAWKLRSKFSQAEHLVFPNKRGGFESHDNMTKRRFYPLFAKLAALHEEDPAEHPRAPDRFTWHALRHFAISTWIEAGLQPKTIQTYAGHSSLQVTLDRYGHMFKSDDHRLAMDQIAKGLF